MVEFVSYDGRYPNLCSGTLVLRINGEERVFPEYCMHSGGCACFDEEWNDYVVQGEWSVDVPDDLLQYKKEIEECVNENVPFGCCGGCI